jgi:hypothetical protein
MQSYEQNPKMTAKENAFMEQLQTKFETKAKNGKHEDMSGMEKAVFEALKTELEKPGESGKAEIKKVSEKAIDDTIDDIKSGKKEVKDMLNTGSRVGNTLGRLGAKVPGLKDVIRDGRAVTNAISDKDLASLKGEVNVNDVLAIAFNVGLPEKATADIGTPILKAAGDDLKLSSTELQTLIKDPEFIKAAKEMGGATLKAQNEAIDSKDALVVGGQTVVLSTINKDLRLADDVPSGDVAAQNVGTKPAAGKGKGKG